MSPALHTCLAPRVGGGQYLKAVVLHPGAVCLSCKYTMPTEPS